MTRYLSVDELVEIALGVVGPHVTVLDPGLLSSVAARPQASAFGQDAYEGLDEKAAALLVSIACNHALEDGNKRLAWSAMVTFCLLNGWLVTPRARMRPCTSR